MRKNSEWDISAFLGQTNRGGTTLAKSGHGSFYCYLRGDPRKKAVAISLPYCFPFADQVYTVVATGAIILHLLWKPASSSFQCGLTASHSLGIL